LAIINLDLQISPTPRKCGDILIELIKGILHMKKSLLLAALLALSVVACSKTETPAPVAAPAAPAAEAAKEASAAAVDATKDATAAVKDAATATADAAKDAATAVKDAGAAAVDAAKDAAKK
jgi:hypothetical protein